MVISLHKWEPRPRQGHSASYSGNGSIQTVGHGWVYPTQLF